MFQYKQSDKMESFYFYGLILSLIPAYYSLYFKIDKALILKSGVNAALLLKAPFLFLLNYLLFNEISKRLYSAQLIIPPRNNHHYDIQEGRYAKAIDWIAFISGVIIIATSGMY